MNLEGKKYWWRSERSSDYRINCGELRDRKNKEHKIALCNKGIRILRFHTQLRGKARGSPKIEKCWRKERMA